MLSHAGFLVKSGHDFAYGFACTRTTCSRGSRTWDRISGFSSILAVLQLGATLVLTEGVPTYPSNRRLWDIVERNGAWTIQGIAPTAARAVMAAVRRRLLGAGTIHTFAHRARGSLGRAERGSGSSPMSETASRPIINYSGGTETGGGILIAYPFLPMARRPAQRPAGRDGRDVLTQDGEFVRERDRPTGGPQCMARNDPQLLAGR